MGKNCLPFITATALVLSFIVVFPQRVLSAGFFELDLISFENIDGREISGGCCSGRQRADGSCPGNCSVFINFCVAHYQKEVDVKGDCTFFQFQTNLLNATTSDTYDLRDQDRMSQPFTFRWPGQFALIVEAWHPPEREGYGKTLVTRFVAQKTLDPDSEWTTEHLTSLNSSIRIKYRVVCDENYYGADCSTFCRPRNDLNGHYMCNSHGQKVCLHGWTNSTEEPLIANQTYTLSELRNLPTHNTTDEYCRIAVCEPKCVMGQCDSPNVCRCWLGWEGPTCSQCLVHPGCKHGYCENKPYTCLCNEGWGGFTCDQDLNYCTNNKPCQNGATCTNTGQGHYTCSCSKDFMGDDCEIFRNPCHKFPCENGATCKNPRDGQYECECLPGYFGTRCDTYALICKDDQCLNGGTCIHDPEGFKCSCRAGFTGVNCEEIDVANCIIYPCYNGGTCVNSSNEFECLCPRGFKGSQCEVVAHCSSSMCKNGGSCVQQDGNVTCSCPTGYSGMRCQLDHNRCASNPCANGATCSNQLDDYRCECPPEYTGRNCNEHADQCHSSPCMNGASCHATPSGFECHCLRGYRGSRCQETESYSVKDRSGLPSMASNVSHRISEEEEEPLGKANIVLVVSLSVFSTVVLFVAVCVMWCMMRRRRRHLRSAEEPLRKAKECDLDAEEERLQNERNAMHMNNKQQQQCDMPRKIVNDLDRVPAKHTNEAPPKVLNKVSNKKIPDKSLLCSPRTFQKIDNSCGTSISSYHSPTQDYPPCNSGAIYIIEDHLRSCPDSTGSGLKDILATEV